MPTEHKAYHWSAQGTGEDKNNHKGYNPNEKLHQPRILARYLNSRGYVTASDIATQGGIITDSVTSLAVGYFRPPFYRTSEGELITRSDVRPVTTANKPENELGFDKTDTGLEIELVGFDLKTGETASMMNPGDPVRTQLQAHNAQSEAAGKPGISFSVEMMRNCVEINGTNGTDIEKRNGQFLSSLQTLTAISEENGIGIAPFSIIPHREITKDDVTNDTYTHKLTFDVQGWEAAQHFDVTSLQLHGEILDQGVARRTVNYMQFVSPVLFAATLSGPFINGQIRSDLSERYKDVADDDLKRITLYTLATDGISEHHSHRAYGRFFGSPSGGILREPIIEEGDKFYEALDESLRRGDIPSAGRAGGHHTDRYRPDLVDDLKNPDESYGTIESCGMDTAGGRLERITALREFDRALKWKMQMLMITGRFDKKAEKYKALFGKKPSPDSFTVAHWNTLEIAKDGTRAMVEGMDEELYPVSELWSQLRAFVQEPLVDEQRGIVYEGLPDGIIGELDNAFIDPAALYNQFKDENGFTSTRGYYETGIGNLSDWALQAAKERAAQGIEEKQAIMEVTKDTAKSFHAHVKNTTIDDIQSMYQTNDAALLERFTRANIPNIVFSKN